MFGRFGMLEPYVNCHKIIEEDLQSKRGALWLGDYQAALDKVGLQLRNIRMVISVVSGIDLHYDKDPKIQHKIYYIHDSPEQDILKIFSKTFEDIENGKQIKIQETITGLTNGSVLVHCMMGISRSASTVIAYLMKKFNYCFSQAYNLVKKKRAIISPNYGFCRQLKEYEKKIIKVGKIVPFSINIQEESDFVVQSQVNVSYLQGNNQLKSSRITINSSNEIFDYQTVPLREKKQKHQYLIKQKQQNSSFRDYSKQQAKLTTRNVSLELKQQGGDECEDKNDCSRFYPILEKNLNKTYGIQNKNQIQRLLPKLNLGITCLKKSSFNLIVLGSNQLNF